MSLNKKARGKLGQLLLGIILVFVLSLNSLLPVSANETAETFKYLSNLDFPTDREKDFFILEIDPSMLDTIDQSLKDFRIYLDQQELSYAKIPFPNNNSISTYQIEVPILNKGTSDKDIYSFVLQMPKYNPDQYITVELDQQLYLVKGELFGSNNNRDWIKLKPVTLYQTGQEINKISLENIDFEYLKVEFQQPYNEILEVKKANLYTQEIQQTNHKKNVKSFPFTVTNDTEQNETLVLIDLQYKNQPIYGWSIETKEKGFYRKVLIEGSNDKENWRSLGSTYIFRDIESLETKLDYEFEPNPDRYLRFRIKNENNQPIAIQDIKIKTYSVKLLVKLPENSQSSSKMVAYWGNDLLKKPIYDVGNFVENIDLSKYSIVKLTTYYKNDQFKEIEVNVPLTESYPFILPGGLILAVVLIGFILYRNIKQMKEE